MAELPRQDNLLAQIAMGNADAYDSLFRKYYSPMVLYADRMLKERADSEDVVGDLFYSLWSNRARLKEVKSEESYLFTLLHHRVIDVLRTRKRVRFEELSESVAQESPEETIFEVDLYAQLHQAIEKLPQKCAEVLRLKMEGYEDREISEKLGIQYETVRSHTKRGTMLIRKRFGKIHSVILFL